MVLPEDTPAAEAAWGNEQGRGGGVESALPAPRPVTTSQWQDRTLASSQPAHHISSVGGQYAWYHTLHIYGGC